MMNASILILAANVMNSAAEALLAAGLGSRPSLGYPGAKIKLVWRPLRRSKSSRRNTQPRRFGLDALMFVACQA